MRTRYLKHDSVIHVSSAHPYTDNRIHYRECVSLSEAGYEVGLIATVSDISGVDSPVSLKLIPRRRRVKRVLLSSAQAIWLAVRSKSRLVHLHDPELILYIPLLRLLGRIVVYDAHEDLPLQILDKPYVSRLTRFPAALATRGLLKVAGLAHLIVAATDGVASRFPSSRTIVVRNYPRLRNQEMDPRPYGSRQNVAVYIGGISRTRGIAEMIAALDHPSFPKDWSLHLAGAISGDAEDIVHRAVYRGRVKYHGVLAPSEARDLLLESKVGLVTLQGTKAYREALPTKLFEYFAAGLPSVVSDFPLWREIIDQHGGGILVDEKSPAAIAEAVALYARSESSWTRISLEARQSATESLNWDQQVSGLVSAYEGLGLRA